MEKKLNCIALIDDDEATNFFHRMLIKKTGTTDQVLVFQGAMNALDYFKKDEELLIPDLILLDLNMPVMDGWDFLDEFANLPEAVNNRTKVVILTTSPNPEEVKRAKNHKFVSGFKTKPFTPEKMQEILMDNF